MCINGHPDTTFTSRIIGGIREMRVRVRVCVCAYVCIYLKTTVDSRMTGGSSWNG